MLDEHLGYVADPVRLERYRAAIAQAILPGDHVVDLGCGTGILGLLCLQAGAARVTALDSTAMIEVARETMVRAGWADQCEFIPHHSHRVELPERVDVVICDHVGFFGFDYGIIETLRDARRRFLKPDGVSIPASIQLHLAAVESPQCYDLVEGWNAAPVPAEFHWLREQAANKKHAVKLLPSELLSAPAALGCIHFTDENSDYFSWTADLHIERDGVLHGLGGWFDCELFAGITMTNSPLAEQAINRSQIFLPISESAALKQGEVLLVTLMARPADNLITWTVDLPGQGKKFNHSTWLGELLTPADMTRRKPSHVPGLSREGRARITVLSYCDGQRTVQQIEEAVLRDHPNLLPSPEEISRFVAQVLGKDAE